MPKPPSTVLSSCPECRAPLDVKLVSHGRPQAGRQPQAVGGELFEIVAHVDSEMETRLCGYTEEPLIEPYFNWEGVTIILTPFLHIHLSPDLAHQLRDALVAGVLPEYPWAKTAPQANAERPDRTE